MAVVGSVTVTYWLWLHPWFALPDESEAAIERKWADLDEWAQPPRAVPSLRPVLHAAQAIAAERDAIMRRFDRADGVLPAFPEGSLSPNVVEALEALDRWEEDEDMEQAPLCAPPSPAGPGPAELFLLGRTALATAPRDAGAVRVRAVARLAQALRNQGGLLHASVGAELGLSLARWARSRGVVLGAELEDKLPHDEDLFPAAVRESYCLLEWTAAELEADALLAREPRGIREGPWPPFGLYWPGRELLVAKQWSIERLRRIHAHRGDPERLARAVEPLEAKDALPSSLLVRLTFMPIAPHARRLAETVRAAKAAAGQATPPGFVHRTCWQPVDSDVSSCADWCRQQQLVCRPVCSEGEVLSWGPRQEVACRGRRTGEAVESTCEQEPVESRSWLRCCCGPAVDSGP